MTPSSTTSSSPPARIGAALPAIDNQALAAGQAVNTKKRDRRLKKMVHGTTDEHIVLIADTGLVVEPQAVVGKREII